MKRSTVIEIIVALFILLFVYTAVSKLNTGPGFEYTLSKSPLIGGYASIVAWALPATELIVAILLLIPRTKLLGLYASATLMTIFTLYLSYMLAFSPKLPCSCGGILKQMSWKQHLIFNLFFTLLAFWGITLMRRNRVTKITEQTLVRLKTKYSI